MTCEHKPPRFDCESCRRKRGKVYENELDYNMDKLTNVRNLLTTTYDEEEIENVYSTIDVAIDEIEEILRNVCTEAKLGQAQRHFYDWVSSISRTNSYNSGDTKSSKP
jgi:hypothetical protein